MLRSYKIYFGINVDPKMPSMEEKNPENLQINE